MKKRIVIQILAVFVVVFGVAIFTKLKTEVKFPPVEKLSHSDGKIHHPTYGSYPEEIEFYQGMTLMPGQSTTTTAEFYIPIEEEGK